MKAADDGEPGCDGFQYGSAPLIWQPPADGRNPDEQSVGFELQCGLEVGDDRNTSAQPARVAQRDRSVLSGPCAVDDGDNGVGAVAEDADGGLGVMGVESRFREDGKTAHRTADLSVLSAANGRSIAQEAGERG